MNQDPVEFDRRLRLAADAWRTGTRTARSRSQGAARLEHFREVSTATAFHEATALSDAEPLKEPLRRWLFRLLSERVNASARHELERLRQEPLLVADAPESDQLSRRQLVIKLLGGGGDGPAWLNLARKHTPPLISAECLVVQRQNEIARRLKLGAADELSSPFRPQAEPHRSPGGILLPLAADDALPPAPAATERGAAEALAREVLSLSKGAFEDLRLPSLLSLLQLAAGANVPGDFPVHLTGHRLLEYFRGNDLVRGLDLNLWTLTDNLGGSSFIRSLESVGHAWHEALEPANEFFCVAADPYNLERRTVGAVWASLVLNRIFGERHLGVSRQRWGATCRQLALIWLVELCWRALRVLLRTKAEQGPRAYMDAFRDLGEDTFHVEFPRELAGVIARPRDEDAAELAAPWRALARTWDLTNDHDLDWFRNPRAIDQLRSESSRPPLTWCSAEETTRAVSLGWRQLREMLG